MPQINEVLKKETKTISSLDSPGGGSEVSRRIRTVTFDFSDINGYQNLTDYNFIVQIDTITTRSASSGWNAEYRSRIESYTYDSTNGTVTVNYQYNIPGDVSSHNGIITCTCFYI